MIECVPNFSEGRNPATIQAIADAVRSVEGVRLLDVTSDPDHNRSVLTMVGPPDGVADAAFAATLEAAGRIDINLHAGVHPRLGVADVIPFVPLEAATLEECSTLARSFGKRLWDELRIPVYLYESAALRAECARLEDVRKLANRGLAPDIGDGLHPTAGATVVGARRFLIAWNVILDTTNLDAAKAIARAVRESSGGLRAVKALGLSLESRGQVQVSINLVDFSVTPLWRVFDAITAMAEERSIGIAGSELIGVIPRAALDACSGHELRWLNLRSELVLG